MEETALPALQTIRDNGVLGSVLVLCILSLFWMVKRILSDKDKTIEILRGNIEKKDSKMNEMFGYMATVSNTQEKMLDTIEKNHLKSEGSLEKILDALSRCRDAFTSMQLKKG